VLHSPPISLLPKDLLKAPSHNPVDPNASPAYQALPSPSAAQSLRNPDQRFLDSEAFTNKFASHVSGPLEKVTRRILKRWSEFAQDHADLGAVLNGYSLTESGTTAAAVEKTGQAADATYLATTQLLQDLEQRWAEPLHEYSQFASIIKRLLVYRHQKHLQFELAQDIIEHKKDSLEDLERSEAEAQRLESALSRPSLVNGVFGAAAEGDEAEQDGAAPGSVRRQPEPVPPSAPRRRPPGGSSLLSALSHSLQTIMDVDPAAARRNSISKTRETLAQLEDGLMLTQQDLKYSSQTIQADLDRFQRQKVADLREMSISMARMHRDWCKKNLEAWEEVKKEVGKMEPHPNQAPAVVEEPPTSPGPSMNRRAGTSHF